MNIRTVCPHVWILVNYSTLKDISAYALYDCIVDVVVRCVHCVPSLTRFCSVGIDGCSGSSTCTCASAHYNCIGGERHKATDGH